MKSKSIFFIVLLAIFGLIVLFFSFSSFITLQPGERGVIFRPWSTGLDKDNVLNEGLHIIAPWNKLIPYDIREQTIEFHEGNSADVNNYDDDQGSSSYGVLDVLDKNGLTINVEVTVRFAIMSDKIGYIHEQFGEFYVRKLVIPEVRSAVRKIMGQYNAEEIYSTKRQEVEQLIIDETRNILNNNYINMTALLIRSIVIPENLKNAIEDKLTKQQEAIAYDYVVQKGLKEKELKIIQAQAIAEYNQIVNASMTPNVLTYEGIQATLQLAQSTNAKIVIIGNSDNGLPIMLSQ
ncbi:MAG: prohibitin family protein [Bacteroidales bacterium]|nr:prohibitin family protein [Bacteroidales bacterium]